MTRATIGGAAPDTAGGAAAGAAQGAAAGAAQDAAAGAAPAAAGGAAPSEWRAAAAGMALPAALLAAWQAAAALGWLNPQLLPSPLAVLQKWWAYLLPLQPYPGGSRLAWALSGELPHDALGSLGRVAAGFALGAGLALPLGLLMGASARAYAWLNPLLQLLRPVPPIAYIPLAILWFGLGDPPAVFLIALGAFFPVLMNTVAGVRQVDAIYLRAARSLGAQGRALFLRVMLPAALPYILAGARIGVGTAFIVVIVSEMIAVNSGLGFRILEAREYFWTDKILAGMASIGLLGLAIDAAMLRLTNYWLRWHRGLEH